MDLPTEVNLMQTFVSLLRRYGPVALGLLAVIVLGGCISFADDVTPPPGWEPTPLPPTPDLSRLYPQQPPDPGRGKAIYAAKCAACHGPQGHGDGPQAEELPVLPANLTAPEVLQEAVPQAWFLVVSNGVLDRFMPPFKGSLTEAERWDVIAYVYRLGTPDYVLEKGQAVYAEQCAACHGPTGQGDGPDAPPGLQPLSANQEMFARISDTELGAFLTGHHDPRFADMDLDALRAVIRYTRLLTFAQPPVAATATATAAPTATPTPATPEPTATLADQASPTAEGEATPAEQDAAAEATTPATATAEPSPTPGATATPTPEGMFTVVVTGRVVHGGDKALPPDLMVTLHGFDEFDEVVTLEGTVAEDGTFRFEDVPALPHRVFLATVEYQGLTYVSDVVTVVPPDQTDVDLTVQVYDTTTDTTNLRFQGLHIFVDFLGDRLRVAELYLLQNTGTETVIAAEEGAGVVRYYLPAGATNLQFEQGQGELGDRFIPTDDGFEDTFAVPPGQFQVLFAYELPYPERQAEIRHKVSLPVDTFAVLVPAEGVTVEGEGLVPGEVQDVQGMQVRIYQGPSLNPDDEVDVRLSGYPKELAGGTVEEAEPALPGLGQVDSSWLLIGGLVLLGLALMGGGWWLYRRAAADEEASPTPLAEADHEAAAVDTAEAIPEALRDDPDALMDAILALDDLHKAGKIRDDIYQARRAAYKAHLARLLARAQGGRTGDAAPTEDKDA